MPARTATGRSGHASATRANSGDSCCKSAKQHAKSPAADGGSPCVDSTSCESPTVFKTVVPCAGRTAGGFDSHALPPFFSLVSSLFPDEGADSWSSASCAALQARPRTHPRAQPATFPRQRTGHRGCRNRPTFLVSAWALTPATARAPGPAPRCWPDKQGAFRSCGLALRSAFCP